MRIGLQIPHFHYPESTQAIAPWLKEIAQTAEAVGFDSVWVMDHFFQLGLGTWLSPVEAPMLEGYNTLSYLAGLTQRIKLGLLVGGVIYRHPGILIKTATTLDVLSGGRSYFGIGAAWYEEEARGLGVPFPPLKERYEQLEETLLIAKQMWADDASAYHGKHFQLEQPLNRPQPINKPHPPIMIGGSGEKKTLRLVAKYADACNISGTFYGPVEEIGRLLGVLKGHCEDVGRPYEEIERTVLDTFDLSDPASVPGVIERCRAMANVGVQTVLFNMPHAYTPAIIELVGREIIPAIAEF
ncbi:MAG: LLM class F420-dependent oxidoreductase [Chloroflexi bacterium]|nr:LLM class F420-dependent oxidoreductase [Chloroflexota bacterium]